MEKTRIVSDVLTPICDAYRDAVLHKDVDAFVALYAADVRIFDLWETWSYDGRDAWRRAVAGWFGSLGDERVAVSFDDVRVTVRGDLAIAHAFVTYRNLAADGAPGRAMQNRLSWTLVRAEDRWSIVHEHTSAPVAPATGKVVLQR